MQGGFKQQVAAYRHLRGPSNKGHFPNLCRAQRKLRYSITRVGGRDESDDGRVLPGAESACFTDFVARRPRWRRGGNRSGLASLPLAVISAK